jgi:uncharacterized lipoprotein YddW (UPF0748 family)
LSFQNAGRDPYERSIAWFFPRHGVFQRPFVCPLVLGFLFCLIGLAAVRGAESPTPAAEQTLLDAARPMHAVWVEATGAELGTADSCKALIERLRKANVTHVFVECSKFGRALYPSKILPPLNSQNTAFDPLNTLLQEATRPGQPPLRVVAVVDLLTLHNTKTLPAQDANHPLSQHADWVTRSRSGETQDATGGVYYDPGVPQLTDYLESIVREIATRYPVEGIHFAGWRYPETNKEWGYNPLALSDYRKQMQLTDGSVVPEPSEPQWISWRQERLTYLLARLSKAVLDSRPSARVSVSVIASGDPPGEKAPGEPDFMGALQQWPVWCHQGVVHAILLEDYYDHKSNVERFIRWIDFAQGRTGAAQLIVGVSGRLNPESDVVMQLRLALGLKAVHTLLYSYQQPVLAQAEGSDIFAFLGRTVFSASYDPPPYVQQTIETVLYPNGQVLPPPPSKSDMQPVTVANSVNPSDVIEALSGFPEPLDAPSDRIENNPDAPETLPDLPTFSAEAPSERMDADDLDVKIPRLKGLTRPGVPSPSIRKGSPTAPAPRKTSDEYLKSRTRVDAAWALLGKSPSATRPTTSRVGKSDPLSSGKTQVRTPTPKPAPTPRESRVILDKSKLVEIVTRQGAKFQAELIVQNSQFTVVRPLIRSGSARIKIPNSEVVSVRRINAE